MRENLGACMSQDFLWNDERIEDAVTAKSHAIANQGNTVSDPTFWRGRARVRVTLEICADYEARIATLTAGYQQLERELGRLALVEVDNERLVAVNAELQQAHVCPHCNGTGKKQTLGYYLHSLRIARGFTLHDVAKSVDIDPGLLHEIERYDLSPIDRMLKRLALHYGVSVDDLRSKVAQDSTTAATAQEALGDEKG